MNSVLIRFLGMWELLLGTLPNFIALHAELYNIENKNKSYLLFLHRSLTICSSLVLVLFHCFTYKLYVWSALFSLQV